MLKILVADENINENKKCCEFLSRNKSQFETASSSTGIDTLYKYHQMKTDILILNSHFSDIKSTEIVDRLSNTSCERKNSNILLTINSIKEQLEFENTVKIYRFFPKPLNFAKLLNTLNQIYDDNTYNTFNEDFLNKLFVEMYITIGSMNTEILKEAIKECYSYPYLLDNFDKLLEILSAKHIPMTTEDIRNSIRRSLRKLNSNKYKLAKHRVVRMFEPDKNISPKTFLEVIVTYLHAQKNQEIF